MFVYHGWTLLAEAWEARRGVPSPAGLVLQPPASWACSQSCPGALGTGAACWGSTEQCPALSLPDAAHAATPPALSCRASGFGEQDSMFWRTGEVKPPPFLLDPGRDQVQVQTEPIPR